MTALNLDLDPVDVATGVRLRELRVAQRHTLQTLAAAAGVSYQQIQKYESGVNRISVSTMVRLATALGVHPSDLLPATNSVARDADADAIAQRIRALPAGVVRSLTLANVRAIIASAERY